MKNLNNSKLIVCIISFISIALLASLTLLKNIEKTEFFVDETGWISTGYFYSNLLLRGDFEWKKWNCELHQCGTFNSLYNPHVGQWLIGIPLKVFATKGEQEFFRLYDLEKSLEENKKEGKVPPDPILLRARMVSVVIGTLCCLLIFAVGYYSNNLWTGSISAILLIFNKLFITLSTQAMTDIPYNFFLLCACLASIFLLRQSQLRYILLSSLLCGSLIGLSSSVKITGVLVGGLYFFLLLLYKKFVSNMKVKDAVKCLTAFSLSALFTIYLVNPYYWPSLKEISIKETIQEVATYYKQSPERKIQKENISNEHPQLYISDEYPQLSNLSHVLEFPRMFLRVKHVGDAQYIKHKSAQWGENRLRTFHETFRRVVNNFPKEIYLLVLGIILLGRKLVNSIYRKKLSESAIPFLFFGANYVFILFFMRVNWDRYYLPTVIASKIIVAVGIYEASRLILALLRRSAKLISPQR